MFEAMLLRYAYAAVTRLKRHVRRKTNESAEKALSEESTNESARLPNMSAFQIRHVRAQFICFAFSPPRLNRVAANTLDPARLRLSRNAFSTNMKRYPQHERAQRLNMLRTRATQHATLLATESLPRFRRGKQQHAKPVSLTP